MRFKAVMVDVDGVVIVHPDPQGLAHHLERDLGLSSEALQNAFFRRHWQDVILGRAALRERLSPVLAEIAPHLSLERLVRYWFENDAHYKLPTGQPDVEVTLVLDDPDRPRLADNDYEIIDNARSIKDATGRRVVIATFDSGMRLRARAAGVEATKATDGEA